RLLEREDWHGRLLFGTDYPLPGVLPLISVNGLVDAGLLPAAEVPVLNEIRRHNPLLFDFVLKRRLAAGGEPVAAHGVPTRPVVRERRSAPAGGRPGAGEPSMTRVAILDDYQGVALRMADWGRLPAGCEVVVFRDHLAAPDAVAARLAEFDVVMVMRERTPF